MKRSLWAACRPTTGIQRPKWSNERKHWCTLVCETRQRSGAKEAERSAGEGTRCWLPGRADRRRALRSRAGASRRRSLAAERTHGRQGRKKQHKKKNRSVSSERASLNGLVNLHSDGLYVTLGLAPEREPPLTSVSHPIRGSSPALQMSQVTPENQKQQQQKNGKNSLGPSDFFWLYFFKPVSCHLSVG